MQNVKKLFMLFSFSAFSLSLSAFPYEKPQKDDPEIIVAVKNRDIVRLEELIEFGVDLEAKGKINDTPLFWAFYFMWVDGAKKLIEAGANIHYEDEDTNFWHVLMLSCRSKENLEMNKASLELFAILKEHKVELKSFLCENLDDIREFSKGNPQLAKKFFSEIRFKKTFWWVYWLIYRPFINFTDLALYMEKNAGHWDD